MIKCPFCEYEWEYKPTKHTKQYYACCPQCRKYIPLRKGDEAKRTVEQVKILDESNKDNIGEM